MRWLEASAAAPLVGAAADGGDARAYAAVACAYGAVAAVALVQLLRIQARVPEYGWTTQKVFHLLNFVQNGMRAAVFALFHAVDGGKGGVGGVRVLSDVLVDAPMLLFFTTYTLLVLFWAEIFHQARSLPTERLKPCFVLANALVYLGEGGMWVAQGVHYSGGVARAARLYLAAVSLLAAAGFVVYGGQLFCMLRRFPVESKGRSKKMLEVGSVTAICTLCFAGRAAAVLASEFAGGGAALDAYDRPFANALYYGLTELVPSVLVLFILRKLPPKRASAGGYEPIG